MYLYVPFILKNFCVLQTGNVKSIVSIPSINIAIAIIYMSCSKILSTNLDINIM